MKKSDPALLITLLAAAALLAACSPAPSGPSGEHGDLGLFQTFCTECHSAEQVKGLSKSVDEWKTVTRKMSRKRFESFGEGIPEEDQERIIEYLTREKE